MASFSAGHPCWPIDLNKKGSLLTFPVIPIPNFQKKHSILVAYFDILPGRAKIIVIGELTMTFEKEDFDLFKCGERTRTYYSTIGHGTTKENILIDIADEGDGRYSFQSYFGSTLTCNDEVLIGTMFVEDEVGLKKIITFIGDDEENMTFREWLLPKDEFTGKITLHLQVLAPKSAKLEHKEMQKKNVHTLLGDFAALRKNGLMADVTIVHEEGRFPAHKNVLSARSEVFAAMFGHTNTLENQQNEVQVNDGDKVTMDNFLTFLYEATLPDDLDFDGYVKLFKVAHKYQVASLIEASATKLGKNISTSRNAVHGAILGYVYGINELKDMAVKAIVESDTTLSSMEGYKELMEHPALLVEIIDYPKSKKPPG